MDYWKNNNENARIEDGRKKEWGKKMFATRTQ
jgi:hypothetical protein